MQRNKQWKQDGNARKKFVIISLVYSPRNIETYFKWKDNTNEILVKVQFSSPAKIRQLLLNGKLLTVIYVIER